MSKIKRKAVQVTFKVMWLKLSIWNHESIDSEPSYGFPVGLTKQVLGPYNLVVLGLAILFEKNQYSASWLDNSKSIHIFYCEKNSFLTTSDSATELAADCTADSYSKFQNCFQVGDSRSAVTLLRRMPLREKTFRRRKSHFVILNLTVVATCNIY